jgi:hypothetical protein
MLALIVFNKYSQVENVLNIDLAEIDVHLCKIILKYNS